MQNPYTPPTSDLATEADAAGALATRGQRFFAAILDGILMMIVITPVLLMSGYWSVAARGQGMGLGATLAMGLAGFLAYVLVNGYFLAQSGQTVGKRAMKIKIVKLDGSQPSLSHILIRRLLPVQILSLIPFIGGLLGLVDTLFIFRADKRCVHDLIADTVVVSA